uniref:CN hydrolase domain-containing protein n=1 Tax=Aegilops tauschii subsp. strangulata TaxID=200361 RepID=A0A453K4T7_AEGTS
CRPPEQVIQAAGHRLPLLVMALASFAVSPPIAASAAVLRRAMSFSSVSAASQARVGVVQMTSVGDLDANYATCSRLTKEAAAAGVKFLCFPEVFSFIGSKDGESVKLAEPLDGPIMQRYCSLANESSMWLSLGGFQERGPDDSHQYNTHVLIDESGKVRSSYRKIHLFDVDVPGNMVYKESRFTTAGDTVVVVDSPFGRLGLTVCYDLRFPELYQCLRFKHQAQVLLVPSAFTKVTGEAHWEILLRARAIETQCYVIAAAQAGKHNEKRESYGDSIIIDPWGTVIARLPADRLSTGFAVADIDLSKVEAVRSKMPISEHRKFESI